MAAGLIMIALLCACAASAPLIAPHDPYRINDAFNAPPDREHILGTDSIGRDVLSRLIYGSRVSLCAAVGSVAVATALGIALGLEAGYFGGFADLLIMRIADVFLAFPSMLLIMVVSSMVGPGLFPLIMVMGFLGWPAVARLARGSALAIKERDYIKAARALGFSHQRILFRHILPNLAGPLFVQAAFGAGRAILVESSLSFLGLGVNPPTASWGNMLTDAQSLTTLTTRPWLWVPPGVCILLSVLAFNLVGDSLRDLLDQGGRGFTGPESFPTRRQRRWE
jgi:peptide/nickel transport system permease protein